MVLKCMLHSTVLRVCGNIDTYSTAQIKIQGVKYTYSMSYIKEQYWMITTISLCDNCFLVVTMYQESFGKENVCKFGAFATISLYYFFSKRNTVHGKYLTEENFGETYYSYWRGKIW